MSKVGGEREGSDGREGVVAALVGLAQFWAMRPWFPMLTRRMWWLGTLIGALAAYVLGYLPSTLMSLGEQSVQTTTPGSGPPQWIVLLLAAGLGAVNGAAVGAIHGVFLVRLTRFNR